MAMPSLSPRSHADSPDLAAKPTHASNTDQGYLVMERTALRSRSNCAVQAWPDQATGAALPKGSSPIKSEAQVSFPPHYHSSLQTPRSTKHRTHSSFSGSAKRSLERSRPRN